MNVWVKVAGFFGVWIGLWLPIAVPLALWVKWRPFQSITPQQKVPLVVSLYAIAPIVVGAAIYVEAVSWQTYGVVVSHRAIATLVVGAIAAVVELGVFYGGQWFAGWLDWQPNWQPNWQSNWQPDQQQLQAPSPAKSPNISALWLALPIALLVGGVEELVFRGVVFQVLQQDLGLWQAAAGSSLVFAGVHLVWNIRETLPQLPGLWLMGMVLVLARLWDDGSIALAWGLHAGWIWGLTAIATLQPLRYRDGIPLWWTGGKDMPLTGMASLLLLLLTGLGLGLGAR